ncbi:MAG: hypothetical protein Kow0049_11240 [Stanieria sp.]
MSRKIVFGLIWLTFVSYAFLFAPATQPNTFDLIVNLSTGNWDNINPLVIALFNLMGVLPGIYACFLFIDGDGQKIKAAPFAIASFGVGAFALLPYLALRQPNPTWQGDKNFFIKIVDARLTGIILIIAAIVLLSFGLIYGNWADFIYQWQTSKFIHVMSLDFCLLVLLLPTLVNDDFSRRNINNNWLFWAIALVPLFGTLIYLCLRPPLPENIYKLQESNS